MRFARKVKFIADSYCASVSVTGLQSDERKTDLTEGESGRLVNAMRNGMLLQDGEGALLRVA